MAVLPPVMRSAGVVPLAFVPPSSSLTLEVKHKHDCLSNRHDRSFRHYVTIGLVIDWNEIRIPQEIGGWTVEMYWPEDEIQGGPLKLVIRPTDEDNVPLGGISSTVLRAIDFRTGAAKAREEVAAEDLANAQLEEKPLQVAMPLLKTLLDKGGLTDVYLVLLAHEYIARVVRGEAKPVDHIAEELGKSLGTVKNHLWQARNRGLLKGGSAGRKGGYVPPEAAQIALDWLDEFGSALTDSAESET